MVHRDLPLCDRGQGEHHGSIWQGGAIDPGADPDRGVLVLGA